VQLTETLTALPARRPVRAVALFVVLAVLLVLLAVLSLTVGQASYLGSNPITPGQVFASVFHRIGLPWGTPSSSPTAEDTLWVIRFPRVAMSLLVGAALATAGAVMQGVFGNPLAEPGVVGVSAGAAVGASLVVVFDLTVLGTWTLAAAGFAGGILTTFLVYRVARSGGRTEVITMILTGVAINAFAGAAIGFFQFYGDTQEREEMVFWQLGSIAGSRWSEVDVVAVAVGVGVAGAIGLSRRLDLLALGDRPAAHLGVNVERLRLASIVVVGLLTSVAVAFCGIIAFVGLVVPHLIRMIVGPGHRVLVPASALAGGVLLLAADIAARTVVPYADLPIGMLTTVVGGPFFFYLLVRNRRRSGGWA
jgi:iron complex transport system permease protein